MNVNASQASTVGSTIKGGNTLWITCQAIVSFCTAVDIYIFFCFVLYYLRTFHPRNCVSAKFSRLITSIRASITKTRYGEDGLGQSRFTNEIAAARLKRTQKETVLKRWMLRFAVLSSFFALLKYLVDQAKFFVAWNARSDHACEIANDITEVALYGTCIILVYAFLWVRQWMFYNNPAVRDLLYCRSLIRFSRWLPVVILGLSSILVIFHLIPHRYRTHTGGDYVGCVSVYDLRNPSDAWPIITYIALTSIFQVSLMALFIYPFVRRTIDTRTDAQPSSAGSPVNYSVCMQESTAFMNASKLTIYSDHQSVTTEQNSGEKSRGQSVPSSLNSRSRLPLATTRRWTGKECARRNTKHNTQSKSKELVFRSVRRVVIWCFICVITDVTAVSVTLYLGPGTPLILITCMNDVNILANELCLVATYNRWKEIIFPFYSKKQKKQFKRNRSSMSASGRGLFVNETTTIFRLEVSSTNLATPSDTSKTNSKELLSGCESLFVRPNGQKISRYSHSASGTPMTRRIKEAQNAKHCSHNGYCESELYRTFTV